MVVLAGCGSAGVDMSESAKGRRLGPPLSEVPVTLRLCVATSGRPASGETGGVVLYGLAKDPYSSPMVAIAWGEESHAGDGDSTPVRVRGTTGVAAPISVFQQVVLADLGTVIAWEENGLQVGLYGRGWSLDEADELVSIADNAEFADGRYRLSDGARPPGLRQVSVGRFGDLGLVFPPAPNYQIHYQGLAADDPAAEVPVLDPPLAEPPPLPPQGGIVTVSGFLASPEEYEAVRFFAPGLAPGTRSGRPVIAGNAWSAEGPTVVTWREPDGLVVRIVGLGAAAVAVEEVARATRELTGPEWEELVGRSGECV